MESRNEVTDTTVWVRILKRTEKLPENVSISHGAYGKYTEYLDKADRAFSDGLGAGAIVYLREIMEGITYQVAQNENINLIGQKGKRRPFRQSLEEVDKKCHIIPKEFSEKGYRLFSELSEVVHGNSDEETSLKKYSALKRLVIGILDNVKNNETLIKSSEEILQKIRELGWNDELDGE